MSSSHFLSGKRKCEGVAATNLFVSDEDDGDVGAEVLDLGRPLLGDVFQRVGRVDAETHEDDVRVGVGERPQPVVVLLAGRIPEGQLNLKFVTNCVLVPSVTIFCLANFSANDSQ